MNLFNIAFEAMAKSVEAQGIIGTAVAGYLADKDTMDWQLSIRVFGKVDAPPREGNPGWNIIGTACGKAAESMLTKHPSGTAGRDPLRGEVGIQGSTIRPCGSGYVVAAFSGAKVEQDVAVAQAGVDAMAAALS